MKYMLDTVIFNKLLDDILSMQNLPSGEGYVATHVQWDELSATKNEKRRAGLLKQFATVSAERHPTSSFAFDISRFDLAEWGSGDLFNQLKTALDAKNGRKTNNPKDALIAETSIVKGFPLVTCDYDLAEVAKAFGGTVIHFKI